MASQEDRGPGQDSHTEHQKPKSALASPNIDGQSPRVPSMKSVSIAEPDNISSMMPGPTREVDTDSEQNFNLDTRASAARQPQYRASIRRIGSRPSIEFLRARTPADLLKIPQPAPQAAPRSGHDATYSSTVAASRAGEAAGPSSTSGHHSGRHYHLSYRDLMKWIQKEKSRRSSKKQKKKAAATLAKLPAPKKEAPQPTESSISSAVVDDENAEGVTSLPSSRRPSDAESEGSTALDMLQEILERNMTLFAPNYAASNKSSHSIRKLNRHSSATIGSDSDFYESEHQVPSCDVILDNRKTLSYTGGLTEASESRPDLTRSYSTREQDAWRTFKYEIVRLTHTLKIKGWRRIELDKSDTIGVERLSGALTNAVYEVNPPKDIPESSSSDRPGSSLKSKPARLLLRIYGAQVDHLIDRESELAVLRRLARKRIGPRLLGTFLNGRFEEFFNARPLNAEELSKPDISRQIAKRMRELHDGIELLNAEIQAGPFVWQNIDKWMARCERIVAWVEGEMAKSTPAIKNLSVHGHLVGSDFKLFKEALLRYRKWLEEQYHGKSGVNDRLVFAHNDAQYGNILRLIQEGGSPLPANEHKRLIVIDFEYANANVPGLEFANHFTEWCYDYHNADTSFACSVSKYPTPAEQNNFLSAYVSHRPSFPPAAPSNRLSTASLSSIAGSPPSTPNMSSSTPTALNMLSSLMLEARAPSSNASAPASSAASLREPPPLPEDEDARRALLDQLRWETRIWRGVNSAQWVMWGIVQAKIEGMPAFEDLKSPYLRARDEGTENRRDSPLEETGDATPRAEPRVEAGKKEVVELGESAVASDDIVAADNPVAAEEKEEDGEEGEGFDYLAYSLDRAKFFWGDVLGLGIMGVEEVPEDVRMLARVVDY
ncbi:hypothetical protein BT63DRAFT_476060 [Microthyrium microscopicum]|uniref:Choline kinase N-terminal domain-containing protein n=1 Tax=Microthyrium microscopicum TaxID=703497 RepID=A0A6A6UQ55_9PEZI|nr:hypothetical protein BT63DRAFT_476060 [Microthyrium microscopicum]